MNAAHDDIGFQRVLIARELVHSRNQVINAGRRRLQRNAVFHVAPPVAVHVPDIEPGIAALRGFDQTGDAIGAVRFDGLINRPVDVGVTIPRIGQRRRTAQCDDGRNDCIFERAFLQ